MNVFDIETPNFLIDLSLLEQNITEMAEMCRAAGKELWPMIKTHKSTQIVALQRAAGAAGFLTGTLDEAETLVDSGFDRIMLAYPVASAHNIRRVVGLAKKAEIYLTLDGVEAAAQMNQHLRSANLTLDYLIKIDCGLHRLGVPPERAADLALQLGAFRHLRLKGISTHPGHVYGAATVDEVVKAAREETAALQLARDCLHTSGFPISIVATGSTPTVSRAMKDPIVTALRPGNYVFYDNIQMALGVVPEERCSLSILATILSQPQKDVFIMDAGSKCLGLDKGAHGNSLLSGFGLVKGHPELLIVSLSEEIGKLKISDGTSLSVGDKIQVIPNHSCSAANMTDCLIGHRNGTIEEVISIDMRGGSRYKNCGNIIWERGRMNSKQL
jgi:D-serine deaminase-like pyridoxal phosphate-dependent protein